MSKIAIVILNTWVRQRQLYLLKSATCIRITAHKLDITYSFNCSFTRLTLPHNSALFIEVSYLLTYIRVHSPHSHSLTICSFTFTLTGPSTSSLAHSFTHWLSTKLLTRPLTLSLAQAVNRPLVPTFSLHLWGFMLMNERLWLTNKLQTRIVITADIICFENKTQLCHLYNLFTIKSFDLHVSWRQLPRAKQL
jgi:hypothetical protein